MNHITFVVRNQYRLISQRQVPIFVVYLKGKFISNQQIKVRTSYKISVIYNEWVGLVTASMSVYMLPWILFKQLHFFTMSLNIDQNILATFLTFSCFVSIVYNCLWTILPLHPASSILCPQLSTKRISNNYLNTVGLVPAQYGFIVF